MAVKIRLARRGRKKLALFDLVVTDSRFPRDGRFIEKIGTFDPRTDPAALVLDDERAFHWLMKGALPSDTVRTMLSQRGIMLRKHLEIGVLKGALTSEDAAKKLEEWKKEKDTKLSSRHEKIKQTREEAARSRKEAESKVKEARAEAIRKKAEVAAAAEAAAEATASAAEANEEATVAEAPAAETPVAPEAAAPAEGGEAPKE